ncbi:MAG: hypothetical protein JNL98_17725 [Bryobacterales bacterium]|nr:hypothetical protein [Bryobacterales bacterium]
MPDNNREKTGGRGRPNPTRWKPGQSGNPAGRPRGSRNRATLLAQQMVEEDAEEILSAFLQRAKEGDTICMRVVVDRLLPRNAGRYVHVDVPPLTRIDDVAQAMATVISAAGSGELDLSEARAFVELLSKQAEALGARDLELRLEALEEQQANVPKGGRR